MSHNKRQKTKLKETEQVSQAILVGMLELPGQELKTTMINMLKSLMDKIGSLQEQMGDMRKKKS